MATEERKEYQRNWVAQRRASFYEGKSCVKCGSTDQLQLDHIDPSQKVSHRIWSWSEARRSAEIAKCQILCHDCHVVKGIENQECLHGELHPRSKLTEDSVKSIREALSQNSLVSVLATNYGVSPRTIRGIKKVKFGKALRCSTHVGVTVSIG